ncbi:hypothetical protein L873DRAFT_678027 [Choiromyces venosus 120613-1]|uniref:C2H2-type domain-containing protein n=1 Tax=Choiromyces venosus 120613-1 TaxID=1336337 RepID=A0A3N4JSN6_9PEZI|nr:hypothetical protein L873DRAFT_678027 [Choiromyces venosus 120613-1]
MDSRQVFFSFILIECRAGLCDNWRLENWFLAIAVGATGQSQPLSRTLGPLPLHRDGDGFYSVLGPSLKDPTPLTLSQAAQPNNNIPVPNGNAALGTYHCGYHRCAGNSGPHTCSRCAYTCEALGCARSTPFKMKQALNRHIEMVHMVDRVDCPVPGCERVGENGIKRKVNLPSHLWNKHRIPAVSPPQYD